MKAIVKLLIVVAVLNATARTAMAAWSYYQLKDSTQQTIIFGANATTAELQQRILQLARELDLPLDPQNVEVTREGPRTLARASYTQPVELFPRYSYPFDFSFSVDALAINPANAVERRAPR